MKREVRNQMSAVSSEKLKIKVRTERLIADLWSLTFSPKESPRHE